MHLTILPGDELPIYRQIMDQISEALAGGHLAAGDKLPSHRDLAQKLVISPLTVKKAYDELENSGVIETRRGRGTFVAASAGSSAPPQSLERIQDTGRRLLSLAWLAGLDYQQVLTILEKIQVDLQAERSAARRSADEEDTP